MILPKQFIITAETGQLDDYIDNGTYAVALGIQGPPGLRFWINEDKTKTNNDNSIELGRTGIYELDLSESGGHITSLIIDFSTLNKSKVIIDLLKEEGQK